MSKHLYILFLIILFGCSKAEPPEKVSSIIVDTVKYTYLTRSLSEADFKNRNIQKLYFQSVFKDAQFEDRMVYTIYDGTSYYYEMIKVGKDSLVIIKTKRL